MNVVLYYYYLFYTRILPDDQPYSTVIFTLSLSESFLINGIISLISARFFCYYIDIWPLIGILILLMVVNYLYYYRSDRMKIIIHKRPKFLQSNFFSICITIFFFLTTVSFMFWGPICTKKFLEIYCNK